MSRYAAALFTLFSVAPLGLSYAQHVATGTIQQASPSASAVLPAEKPSPWMLHRQAEASHASITTNKVKSQRVAARKKTAVRVAKVEKPSVPTSAAKSPPTVASTLVKPTSTGVQATLSNRPTSLPAPVADTRSVVIEPRKIASLPDVYYAPDTIAITSQAPQAIKRVPAEISDTQLRGLDGYADIVVRLQVNPDGRVADATVLQSAKPEWHTAVLAAARQWQYPPASHGQTAEVVFRFAPPQ